MATPYEVKQFVVGDVWQFAGLEECSFKSVTASGSVALSDPRIEHIDPSAGVVTRTLTDSPYKGYTYTAQNKTADMTAIVIDGNGKNINGNPTLTFSGAYAGRTVQYDDVLDAYIVIRSVG